MLNDEEYYAMLWYLDEALKKSQANIHAELERFEAEYDKIIARYHGTSAPPNPPTPEPPPSGPTAAINLQWGNPPVDTRGTNANIGSGSTTTVVGRLAVPVGATSPTNTPGVISVVEYDGAQAERVLSLSTQPNDFRGWTPGLSAPPPTDPTGAAGPIDWGIGINPNVQFLLSDDLSSGPPKARLIPGQTYYVNLRTIYFATGKPSCTAASCNVRITVNPPR